MSRRDQSVDAGWVARLPAPPPDPDNEVSSYSPGADDERWRDLLRLDYEQAIRQLPMRGWWPILADLHCQLVRVDPDYRFAQIKEKFGVLRVYLDMSSDRALDEADRIVAVAESRSARTCERCGEAGELCRDRRRWMTLCDACDVSLSD
jgi:hypothetical protein